MEGRSDSSGSYHITENMHLELILESSGIGTWELELESKNIFLSNLSRNLLGFSSDRVSTFADVLTRIHPADLEVFTSTIDQVSKNLNTDPFSIKFRIFNPRENSTKWLLCRGRLSSHLGQNIPRILGTFTDITDQHPLENRSEKLGVMAQQSPVAMAILSKTDLIVETGNEAFFRLWNEDESILGRSFEDLFSEKSELPDYDQIRRIVESKGSYTHPSVCFEKEKMGAIENIYFDFTYTALQNNSAILVTASEVTDHVNRQKELETSEEKFRVLIEEVPVGISVFTGKDMVVELANEPMIGYWAKDATVIGKPLRDAFPELVGQPFLDILDSILTTGESFTSTNAPVDIVVDGILKTYYFNFTYKPLFNSAGQVYAIIDMSLDVTAEVLAQRALQESESKLRSVIASAPAAMGLFVGRDLVVEMPNQAFIDIVGKGPDITGKPLREVMPELDDQPFLQILDDVYTSGKMFQSFATQVNIVQHGLMTRNFYNITYTPIFDSEGNVYAILDIAIDVTERMVEQMQIEESQMQLLSLFEQSPVAIAMIRKDDLVFTMANPFYGDLVARTPEHLVGKSLNDALPEMAGQGFDHLLHAVIETGVPYISKEQPVDIMREGKLETIYVDLTYQAQRDLEGNISGVFVVATDMTKQVLSRKKIQEAESSLRGAIELADLGTFRIDLKSGISEQSDRLRYWFGFEKEEIITLDKIYAVISESDSPLVKAAIHAAITPGSNGIYDMEYSIDPKKAGAERILHAQGKVFYDDLGEPVVILGTVQDVTTQRKVQLTLELQVQERTEELATMNEELASINEEYIAINEELSESNNLLIQSNENLQQFAYVASHDLQEPLRKIQSFGNLITSRYATELGEGANYLQRMQSAAKRMSNLIEDLLTFSRISGKSDHIESVKLNNVVNSVLTDLELIVQETSAEIIFEDLPEVKGDRTQLGQLFQNLLTNAIKFRKNEEAPVIKLTYKNVTSSELPGSLVPVRNTKVYYKIDVEDNGIGFDQRYADRIFQLFQRLHGKSEYSGTGIGLAICEKVVVNHGGAISVESQVDKGTKFSVFLPVPIY